MLTVMRLYLYGVLGVTLVPMLMGASDLVRLARVALFGMAGANVAAASNLAREDLSRALALVLVAVPIWTFHAWLLRRAMRSSPRADADERASGIRAAYFLIVLAATLIVAGWNAFEAFSSVIPAIVSDERVRGLRGALADLIVFGLAWAAHLRWRSVDLRSAPARTAEDWSTRAYVYGALFVTMLVAVVSSAAALDVVASELLAVGPDGVEANRWQEAIVVPFAAFLVAGPAWLLHWMIALRLVRADAPIGTAHRASRIRRAYLLGIAGIAAAASVAVLVTSLANVMMGVLDVRRSTEGSGLRGDIGGPIVMAVPYLLVWWWHQRRAAREALAFGGEAVHRSVVRTGRLLVALVGLAALALGLRLGIEVILEVADGGWAASMPRASSLSDDAARAIPAVLIGLAVWLSAWTLLQRERARDRLEAARSTARRAYLLFVSGVSVAALAASLTFLIYQASRVILGAGPMGDTAWAIGLSLVAAPGLLYHGWQDRSDLADLRAADAVEGAAAMAGVAPVVNVEAIEISGPAEADFEAINEALVALLPEGFRLRVLGDGDGAEPARSRPVAMAMVAEAQSDGALPASS